MIGNAVQILVILRTQTRIDALAQRMETRTELLERLIETRMTSLNELSNEMQLTFGDRRERIARLEQRLPSR